MVDGETLVVATTFKAGNFEEDFATLAASVESAEPCLLLVRLAGCEGVAEGEWAMIAWNPDDAPVRKKMLSASSHKTVQSKLEGISFKEYHATERDEMTLAAFLEHTRKLTGEDRRAAMTRAEQDLEDVSKACEAEKAAAPKMLAGLVAVQIKAQDSFTEGVPVVLAEDGKALLCKLAGPKNEELSGEVLDEVSAPTALKGRLPDEEPCYVLMRMAAAAEDAPKRLLLISWLPDNSAVKLKMKCSTFKASVMQQVRGLAPDVAGLAQAEVTCEDDLTDDLGVAAAPAEAAAEEESAPARRGPPPGAFALPGMGGRPPPGAFALPGMGAK